MFDALNECPALVVQEHFDEVAEAILTQYFALILLMRR